MWGGEGPHGRPPPLSPAPIMDEHDPLPPPPPPHSTLAPRDPPASSLPPRLGLMPFPADLSALRGCSGIRCILLILIIGLGLIHELSECPPKAFAADR